MFGIFKKKETSRKEKSEAILKKNRIKINYNLPHIEPDEETSLRSPREIAQRTVVLSVTNMVAFDNLSGEEAIKFLQDKDLWKLSTPAERNFLNNPTYETKNHESWKCECIWVLMWSLKIIDDLGFPNSLCNLNDIPDNDYPIGPDKQPSDFIDRDWEIRSKSEILNTCDLYYRMDWACVDARINGHEIDSLNPAVVYERHYALNWLINYMDQDWDNVSCDT